jgi:hypothetical protein
MQLSLIPHYFLILGLSSSFLDDEADSFSSSSSFGKNSIVYPPPPPAHVVHSHVDSLPNLGGIDFPHAITDASGKPLFTGLYSGPYFDLARTPRNVTAQVGGAALLPCRVLQSGGRAVSTKKVWDKYGSCWLSMSVQTM